MVVIVITAPGMATTDIELPGLKRVVLSLMVGQIGLAHLAAPGVIVDRHAIYGDTQCRIPGQRGRAEGRGQEDRRGIVSRNRDLFVRADNARHLFMVRIGIRLNDRVAVGAGDGDAPVKARVGDGFGDGGAVVVMGGGGRRSGDHDQCG